MSATLRKDSPPNPGRIIPAMNVRILATPTEPSAPIQGKQPIASSEESLACHDSEVTLLRDGDQVKTIVIKCACGRVISLDCTY